MRLVTPIAFVLAFASLTGCSSTLANRSQDTAVRAEPRRVSCANAVDPIGQSLVAPTRTWTN
jgi:hypothetical protein